MFSCKFCEIFEHLRTAASGVLKTFQDIFYRRPPTDRFRYNHCVKCPNTEFFWSVFYRIQTEYGAIDYTSVFSPNMGKCRPEQTPYLDNFTQWMSIISAISRKNLPTSNNTKDIYTSSYRLPGMFCKKRCSSVRNFTKFTGKHLYQCLFF